MSSEPLPGPEDIPLDPDLLRTLASDSRRDILRLLKQRRMTLTELATALNLGKATVLEHLKKLQDTQLVARRDDERLWVYYELTPRGKRVVTPGRTRFFLVMGLTAAAALLVGVVLALAFTHASAPARDLGSKSLGEPALLQAQGDVIVWRQLDANATLAVSQGGRPVEGTLFADAIPLATDAQGRVTLDAVALDALPVGNHSLSFLRAAGNAREPVGGFLDVRQPRLAVTPLQVPVGRDTPVALSFADPATPLPVSARVLHPTAPGPVPVQVGRLDPIRVEAVPDLQVSFAPDGHGNLTLAGPPNATVALDGATLGSTAANGTLLLRAPAEGDHVLRVGDATRAIQVLGGNVSDAPAKITLAQAGAGYRATVGNHGLLDATLTLDAVADGRVVASTALVVPAGGEVPVALDPQGLPPGAHVAELQARAPPLTPVGGGVIFAPSGAPPAASDSSMSTGGASAPVPAYDAYAVGPGVVATLPLGTLDFASPSPPAAGAAEMPVAKTPAPGVAILLAAAVAAAALTARRRR